MGVRALAAALGLLAASLAASSGARAEEDLARKGLEIARAANLANKGFVAEQAVVTMQLINAHGDVTRRKLAIVTLEGREDGDRSKVVFEWPPDVKGTKLLTWTHKRGDDDQWLYLPAIKRTRRISGSNKAGSFMGSEFAYEDLVGAEPEKFTYRYLDQVKVAGRDSDHFERFPVDRNSGYGRQVVWLDKEYQNPVRVEYYDRGNVLLKVATPADYRRLGALWRATLVTMENVLTKKRSIFTWESRQLGAPLSPSQFDSARLED